MDLSSDVPNKTVSANVDPPKTMWWEIARTENIESPEGECWMMSTHITYLIVIVLTRLPSKLSSFCNMYCQMGSC